MFIRSMIMVLLESVTLRRTVGVNGSDQLRLDIECGLCASSGSCLRVGDTSGIESSVTTNDTDRTSLVQLLVDGEG